MSTLKVDIYPGQRLKLNGSTQVVEVAKFLLPQSGQELWALIDIDRSDSFPRPVPGMRSKSDLKKWVNDNCELVEYVP